MRAEKEIRVEFADGDFLETYREAVGTSVVLIPALMFDIAPRASLKDWRYIAKTKKQLAVLVDYFGGEEELIGWVSILIDRGIDYGFAGNKGKAKIKEQLANHAMGWDGWMVALIAIKSVLFYISRGESGFEKYCQAFQHYSTEDVSLMMERVNLTMTSREVKIAWAMLTALTR